MLDMLKYKLLGSHLVIQQVGITRQTDLDRPPDDWLTSLPCSLYILTPPVEGLLCAIYIEFDPNSLTELASARHENLGVATSICG